MRKMKGSVAALLMLAVCSMASARETISLNQEWGFLKGVMMSFGVFPDINMPRVQETVNLPHTWNAEDVMTQGVNYYRGMGSYVKQIEIPESYRGKRLFLRFEGAATVCNVFCNQKHLGEHRGGYTGFTYEITDAVKYGEKNLLTVICDNSHRMDIAPQGGDFNIYGGLYRDVWLEVMDTPVCISPLYYGSKGVLISQPFVSRERAEMNVQVHLSTLTDYQDCQVEVRVLNAEGQQVAGNKVGRVSQDVMSCRLYLDQPHLWNGTANPYLYTVQTILTRNGMEIDRVEEKTGLRSFYVDPNKGFFLNGEHLKLHGVCRHQEWHKEGAALTREHHVADNDLFEEMGANAVRLAHYPQAKAMFEEADCRGFVVWEEIPFVGNYNSSALLDENLKQQLTEMIVQNYNHPSICFWGLFNEIHGGHDAIVAEMNELAHKLDPQRLTVIATDVEGSFNSITDAMGWNKYFGWYVDQFSDFAPFFDKFHAENPTLNISVSEYGAGASINHHVGKFEENQTKGRQNSASQFHPEEKQTAFHRVHLAMIDERDYIWGAFIWNMFDFGSSFRNEGDTKAQNDKGLITRDRQNRKDAFYFYKANWNKKEKTVHICSKRYTDRKEALTNIIVFTTAPSVKLYINGKLMGTKRTDAFATAEWSDVTLNQGKNDIRVVTVDGEDTCTWNVQ